MLRRSVVSVQCADQTCLCLVYIPYTHRNSAIAVRHTSPNNVNDERQQIETFIVNRIISTNTCTHLCTKQLVYLHFTFSVPRCSISDAEFVAFVDYQQDHLHHRPTLFYNKFNGSRLWLPFMFICRKIFRKKKFRQFQLASHDESSRLPPIPSNYSNANTVSNNRNRWTQVNFSQYLSKWKSHFAVIFNFNDQK